MVLLWKEFLIASVLPRLVQEGMAIKEVLDIERGDR